MIANSFTSAAVLDAHQLTRLKTSALPNQEDLVAQKRKEKRPFFSDSPTTFVAYFGYFTLFGVFPIHLNQTGVLTRS
jgi:hypothetical protein